MEPNDTAETATVLPLDQPWVRASITPVSDVDYWRVVPPGSCTTTKLCSVYLHMTRRANVALLPWMVTMIRSGENPLDRRTDGYKIDTEIDNLNARDVVVLRVATWEQPGIPSQAFDYQIKVTTTAS